MDINELGKIKLTAVQLPSYLLTGIQQKIESLQSNIMPKKTVLMLSGVFVLVLLLNISVVIKKSWLSSNKIESYTHSLNLMPDNHIYK